MCCSLFNNWKYLLKCCTILKIRDRDTSPKSIVGINTQSMESREPEGSRTGVLRVLGKLFRGFLPQLKIDKDYKPLFMIQTTLNIMFFKHKVNTKVRFAVVSKLHFFKFSERFFLVSSQIRILRNNSLHLKKIKLNQIKQKLTKNLTRN